MLAEMVAGVTFGWRQDGKGAMPGKRAHARVPP